MLLTFSSTKIIFYTVTFFVILQSSYQYIYPCNSSVPCGCSSNPASVSRIVGGEPAGTNTWDWTVSIFVTVGSGAALCGGAILSSSWIITAAHCFSSVNASQVTVYSGSNRLFAGQIRTVASIVVHPSYISNTKVNDIALIKLNTPLAMTNGVKTICIPSVNSSTLTADEWPSADLSVCYNTVFNVFLTIRNQYCLTGRSSWLGNIGRERFNIINTPTSYSSNNCV